MHVWYFLERGINHALSSAWTEATTKAGFDAEVRSGHFPCAGGRVVEVVLYWTLVQGKVFDEVGVVGVVK